MRVQHLVDEYAQLDIQELENAVIRIERRLGGDNVKIILEALHNKDFAKVADMSLTYYDKTYTYGIEQRKDIKKVFIESNTADAMENAEIILRIVKDKR